MRTWNSMKTSGAVLIATLLAAAQAQAIIAYNFPSGLVGNQTVVTDPLILGNEFKVNSAINVTAVGAFENGNGIFEAVIPVAIYNYSGGTWSQVAGTYTTFSGAVGTPNGSAKFQNLVAPVTLSPGTYAIVAANYGFATGERNWNANETPGANRATFQNSSTAISMDAAYTSFYATGTSLNPTLSGLSEGSWTGTWAAGTPTFAGATFEFTPVPEAAHFAMAGIGLLGLVYIGRYARMRRIMKFA